MSVLVIKPLEILNGIFSFVHSGILLSFRLIPFRDIACTEPDYNFL